MDVIIYNRISTDNKNQDPESNLNTIKDFCKNHKHNVITTIIDKGVSGDTNYYDRPEGKFIDKYIEDYKLMNKDLLICVFSMDRFTRQKPAYAMITLDKLRKVCCGVFSATESPFNEESEFSEPIQFNILWFNHYFLIQHSKKVRAGIEKRRLEGKHVGRALIKGVIGIGKNKKYIYYNEQELIEINGMIKNYIKRYSYRETKALMLDQHDTKVSISYISKVVNG